jgi:ATPase family associated with various cellular activities (AAA)
MSAKPLAQSSHDPRSATDGVDGMAFIALRDRKRQVEGLAEGHLHALQHFHYGEALTGLERGTVPIAGFSLKPQSGRPAAPRISISSTTTCVRSLLASPAVGDHADFTPVVGRIEERYSKGELTTTGLDHNNLYTLGQLLPTLRRMVGDDERPELVDDAVQILHKALGKEGVRLRDFPPNGFLTWWALVALDSWGEVDLKKCKRSLDWSTRELYRQLSLFTAEDDEADAYQLGYNLLIQRRFCRGETRDSVLVAALRALFGAQLETGIWEKKEPLFTYGASGDAYPFAFELLNAILREFQDAQASLVEHERALDQAVSWAERNAYQRGSSLWRSGHLADGKEPESWATAEVYFFLQNYRAYLAGQIFALMLRETGRGHSARIPNPGSFANLYQPRVRLDGAEPLIGDLLKDRLLEPLLLSASAERRYSLARNPKRESLVRSGIFFGPPGTGKTTYAKAIARYLGWPLLIITPADFAAEGMLLIPTVARRIFDRLIELQDMVLFFDEMEELMHKRDGDGSFEQRFLTTSFLPALQDLRDNATCVYLVATNNFDDLDEAARAPRRFDFQFLVGPPAYSEKVRMLETDFPKAHKKTTLSEIKLAKAKIEHATLRETRDLYRRIADGTPAREAIEGLTPMLEDRAQELEEEAKNNSCDRAV